MKNIVRNKYLNKIRPHYENDLIKVITGVRRCGKSVLLNQIQDELLESKITHDHIIYINHEDLDYDFILTAKDLQEYLKSRILDNRKYYIFLDEIQHVEEFEKGLSSLRSKFNVSIFVTGSNSKLLSGELATLLTGRTIEFEIMPFTFAEVKEFYQANNIDFSEDLFYDYIKLGGFPFSYTLQSENEVLSYIESLYKSIVNRDILNNTKIDRNVFYDISLYILANAGKEFSADSIASFYNKNSDKTVSANTIYSYIDKMKKAYLLYGLKKYNLVGKASLSTRDKFYAIDTGFRTINTNTINYEDTFFLENIISNEFKSRGYTVFTGKTYKSEIDFVVINNGKKCFVQVSYLLASQKTIDREFGAFSPISDCSPKYVMSLDRVDLTQNGIKHVNIIDYLLGKTDLVFV